MPFLGKFEIQHIWRCQGPLSMNLFGCFDSYILETCLYVSHNHKISNSKVIVCVWAHLENRGKQLIWKKEDFLAPCTTKMIIHVINLMMNFENLGHICMLILIFELICWYKSNFHGHSFKKYHNSVKFESNPQNFMSCKS